MIIMTLIWLVILLICGFIVYLGYRSWKKTSRKVEEMDVNEKLDLLDKEAKLASKISVYTDDDVKENRNTIDEFLEKRK